MSGYLTVGELMHMLRLANADARVSDVLQFVCGRCSGGVDRVEASGSTWHPDTSSTPRPAAKGTPFNAPRQQIEGVPPNSDVQSWCTHDDKEVTVEILSHITVPIDFVLRMAAAKDDEAKQQAFVLDNVGSLVLQWLASLGYHSAEVEMCMKSGKRCGHKVS